MRFRSNNCVAIHLKSLAKAERFFGDVLGFKLRRKTKGRLEYDAGLLRLFINRSPELQPPTLSFSVKSAAKAKRLLKGAGCRIVGDWGGAFYFRDPFGVVHDVIED
jgi:catechol 2,3-dioxygenase-like lactoylglutathione lyase family enzyme